MTRTSFMVLVFVIFIPVLFLIFMDIFTHKYNKPFYSPAQQTTGAYAVSTSTPAETVIMTIDPVDAGMGGQSPGIVPVAPAVYKSGGGNGGGSGGCGATGYEQLPSGNFVKTYSCSY